MMARAIPKESEQVDIKTQKLKWEKDDERIKTRKEKDRIRLEEEAT